ncbi:hypothetical protein DBY21_02730 [Candidatus Gastranaerophilales bacterium]|nr:MAG: hypothetical protein DBY21_02730 [Candidatus Gastranaerophilales bacterium]
MTENNFNFTNGVSYDVWYEQKRLIDQLKDENARCLKALDEIERHFECRCDICRDNYGLGADCSVCWHKDIRNIISKAKDGD